MTRQEFGRRVYSAMLEKGWTQAELARRSDILPDSISNYVRGNILPTPQNLKKLADALGVEETMLLGNYYEQAVDAEVEPAFDMKSSTADPGKAWLRVNQLVSFSTAVKIAELLKNDSTDGPAH